MEKNTIMFVSGFIDIGRAHWPQHATDINHYLQFMEPMLLLVPNIVMFVEGSVYDHFVTLFGTNKIKQYESGKSYLTCLQTDQAIINSKSFQERLQELSDVPVEYSQPHYNILQHNKMWLLQRTKELFPEYSHYAWIDVHYLRYNDLPYSIFVSSSRLQSNQIYIGCDQQFIHTNESVPSINDMFQKQKYPLLKPSTFIVPRQLLDNFTSKYNLLYQEHQILNIVNNDAAFHTLLYCQSPSQYQLLYIPHEGLFYKQLEQHVHNTYQFSDNQTSNTLSSQIKSLFDQYSIYGIDERLFFSKYYSNLFHNIRCKKISMFMIGNWQDTHGHPFDMWKAYFQHEKSHFYGANINIGTLNSEQIDIYGINQFAKHNVMMFDYIALMNLCHRLEDQKFDIIIDSFSHQKGEFETVFNSCFFQLQYDGLYIIEHYPKDTPIEKWFMEKVKPTFPFVTLTVVTTPFFKQLVIIQKINNNLSSKMDHVIHQLPYLEKLYKSLSSLDYEKYNIFSNYFANRKHALEIGTGNYMNLFILLMVNHTIVIDYLATGQYDTQVISLLNELFNRRINVIPFSPLKIINGEFIDYSIKQLLNSNKYDVVDVNINHVIGVTSVDMRLYDFIQNIITSDCNIIYNFVNKRQIHSLIKKEFQILEYFVNGNFCICKHDEGKYHMLQTKATNMYIVSSVICDKNSSVTEQRLNQTLETLKQIKLKEPNAILFVVEGSEYNWYVSQSSVNVQIIYSPPVNKMTKHCGETIQMISCLQSNIFQKIIRLKSNRQRIFKITGRYVINRDFDPSQHCNDLTAVFNHYHQKMYTHLFSFQPSFCEKLLQIYQTINEKMKSSIVNLEEALYHEICQNENDIQIYNAILIGVQGTSASRSIEYRL